MNTILETNIQSVSTGPIRNTPMEPDVYEPISKDKILVHKKRYVYRRLIPSSNNNTNPPVELYQGLAMPHLDEISIIGRGGTLKAIYEKANEVMIPVLQPNELPPATVVYFTQTIKYIPPPSDIPSSDLPTPPLLGPQLGAPTDIAHSTPGGSSSASSVTEVDQAPAQTSIQTFRSLVIASRSKRKLPSRILSKVGARGSRRKNITSDDESCLKRKRRRDDDDDNDNKTSSNEVMSPEPKRRRLVMLGASVMGVSFECCSFQWDAPC